MLLQLQCTLQYKCTETSNKTNSRQLGWLQSSKLEQASQLLSLPMLLQLPMQAARDLPPELQYCKLEHTCQTAADLGLL
jgi:hypothetical protein